MESARRTIRRRRWNALKVVVLLLLALTVGGCVVSYTLSALGLDANVDVTVSLVETFGAAVVAYAIKTLGDHMSMNKHGIEEVEG